jgi:hypothetical protein
LYKGFLVIESILDFIEGAVGEAEVASLKLSAYDFEERIEYGELINVSASARAQHVYLFVVCNDCKDIFQGNYLDFVQDKETHADAANRVSIFVGNKEPQAAIESFIERQKKQSLLASEIKQRETEDWVSLYLMYLHAMMYMFNYYALFPTAPLYSQALGMR